MFVALKSLASEENKIKFLQEAVIVGQFKHPNIVKLHGVVTTGKPVSYTNMTCTRHAPWASNNDFAGGLAAVCM